MRKEVFYMSLILILISCGKGNNPNGGTKSTNPTAAALIFPAQNAVCTIGATISNTQSSVTFTWKASNNTDSYDFDLKNLLTSATITQNTNDLKLTVTLDRNTPYSWYVVSKSVKTNSTAKSDTWKFYNSGPGIITYAPFPAEIISPYYGQLINTTTVDLTWKGGAVNDIDDYDVYLGTTNTPSIFKNDVKDSIINSVPVTSKSTYYWKVITRDVNGNLSDSGLFQFTVN